MKKIFATVVLAISMLNIAHSQEYSNLTMKIGQKAPELVLNNPAGEVVKLSEIYKGRIIMLDFWASWCGPCRRASPEVLSIYNSYKDKIMRGCKLPFTIVSVSLDQNKEAWVKAITDDGLVWPYHMSDLGFWKSKAAELYGVQFIPQSFLISSDGKIIGKYTFDLDNLKKDLDKLLKKK